MPPRSLFVAFALAAAILLGPPARAAVVLECDTGICAGNPCTITGVHRLENECTLDFGTTDVTIAKGGKLIVPDDGFLSLKAHDLTVQGSIQGKGMVLDMRLTGNLRTEGRGRLYAARTREKNGDFFGPNWFIQVDGDAILAGSTIRLSGDWSYFVLSADGNVRIDAPIKSAACFDDFSEVQINVLGSITTSASISSRACGPGAGSEISLIAAGDVNVGGPLRLFSWRGTGFPLAVLVESGGNVTLDSARLSTQLAGGDFDVKAAGNITLLGNVTARGWKDSELYGSGGGGKITLDPGPTGTVTIQKQQINASCGPGCETPGSITIKPACYTDVTGSKFAARIGGTISLGCSCRHPTGSTACDGGCLGLESASFDPPIPMAFPTCP